MSVSDPWVGGTPASTARKNRTSVITDTGTNLAALDKTKHKIVTASSTGSGYDINHVYVFHEDGTTKTDLSAVQDHNHSSASGQGSNFIFTYIANPEVLDLYLSRPTDIIKANWNQTVTGTGSIEDGGGGTNKPYIRLRPNGTSGSGSTISYTNAQNMSFDQPSICTFTGNFETASSLAFHGGVNCDDVTAVDSNTRKIQAEVCTATNSNWWLRTANGSSHTASDLGVAINTGDTSIKMVTDPNLGTPETKIEIDAANEFTKTTTIPFDQSNSTGNILKFSIKNSTAADRPYRFKGARLSWITEDSWGYG